MNEQNYALLCDFYEFTMSNAYFKLGMDKQIVYYDVFFRSVPDNGGFAIAAGLEQIITFIKNWNFSKEDLDYLRSKNRFDEEFLTYLSNFSFTGDVYAVREGTPIFPNEPVITVRATAIQAQLLETVILLCFNHQSLIATKANRIVRAAQGRPVLEFGARRAQGADGAIMGARATFIGGCCKTSCTIADKKFNIPADGTMAHSWVQMFPTELDAFKAYCKMYPNSTSLLVDTYNTIKSGIPNAITAIKEVLLPLGITNCSVRLDSGDLAYLSKKIRKMLDSAGLTDCKIVASNSLDEHLIRDVISQGAKVDIFGVGERMITAKSDAVFGGVYKLVAIEDEDKNIIPKIKVSENTAKITNPYVKKVYRLFDLETGKAIADELCLKDEIIDETLPHTIFDPISTWKTKTITNFKAVPLQVPIFINGECVYELPTMQEIQDYCKQQVDLLWDEVKRFEYPHRYYVDLSKTLWDAKQKLLNEVCEKKPTVDL